MKNLKITVNGKSYDVQVEEVGTAPAPAAASVAAPAPVPEAVPVSYTHLDVYKRQVWSAVSAVHALLQRMVKVRGCRVRIDADFLENETRVELDAKLAIRFIYLCVAAWILWREYRKLIRELKLKKDGAKHE